MGASGVAAVACTCCAWPRGMGRKHLCVRNWPLTPAHDCGQQSVIRASTELTRRYRYVNFPYRVQGPYLALEGLPRPFPRGLAFSYGKEQQQEQCNQQHEEQDKASKAAAATAAEEDIAKPEAVFQEDDEAAVGPGCATSATAVASSSPGAAAPSLALLDYHVCYSLSYQVPLMCFRATWPGGQGTWA